MINLNFDKATVLSLFLEAKGNINPSLADVQQFYLDLIAAWEPDLDQIMAQMAVPRDNATKSRILTDSTHAPAGTPQEMIRIACQYYLNTVNL